MFNLMGVSAFVLKYRVPARPDLPGLPKWWAPLQDAQRAMGLLRANASAYGPPKPPSLFQFYPVS